MADQEPSQDELWLITHLGRINRLVADGMTPIEAAAKLAADESADEYAERNQAAMEALEKRILAPEYMARFAAIQSEPDPRRKAELEADLKRENFAAIDMEAVHRTIRARNRQWKAEGVLPPDAPI